MKKKHFKIIALGLLAPPAAIATLWAAGALAYDGPGPVIAITATVLLLSFMVWRKFSKQAWAVWSVFLVIIIAWWLTLTPPADADWQPEVRKTASATVDGDLVTIHNIRDFDYSSDTDFTERWITREFRLSSITGVDIAVNYWGSPWIAHPIFSFQFSDAPPLAFSIETRKRVGQSYSAIGGLYRQFTLIYIAAEERDVLGVRAIHRKNEDVYLYRTTLTPDQARARFLQYIESINALAEKPRWYHAITTNCTTAIRTQNQAGDRLPLDWRILVNGRGDEMMFEHGMLDSRGLNFPELRKRSHANAAIQAAGNAPDFSARMRSILQF